MGLTVVYRETAAPALRRLRDSDRAAFARVRGIISALADDPYPDSAVPWGHSGYYRLHAGDLRVLYEVDERRRLSTSLAWARSPEPAGQKSTYSDRHALVDLVQHVSGGDQQGRQA